MRKPDILQACQAGSLLLCASLAWQVSSGYEGTEFSGGWLTWSFTLNGGHRLHSKSVGVDRDF